MIFGKPAAAHDPGAIVPDDDALERDPTLDIPAREGENHRGGSVLDDLLQDRDFMVPDDDDALERDPTLDAPATRGGGPGGGAVLDDILQDRDLLLPDG